MDLYKLKKYADLAHDIALTKRNAIERMRARQVMAYNGHLFSADTHIINTVSALMQYSQQFYVLDTNNNPCFIDDPGDFLEKLIQRNQETLNALAQLHEELKRRK